MPHKEKFVSCFVDQFPHFGSATTSRVEGNHHVIKSYVRAGNLHLYLTTKRLGIMLANQQVELKVAIENQRLKKGIASAILAWSIWHIMCLMKKLVEQLELAKQGGHGDHPCSGMFMRVWGLPCRHYIRCCLESENLILLRDIHEQWLLDKNPLASPTITSVTPLVQTSCPTSLLVQKMVDTIDNGNPRTGSLIARMNHVLDTPEVQVNDPFVVVKKRGRPAGSKNKRNMNRDKSHFEYMEGRKCGMCNQCGHNSRTCPRK